LRINKKKFIYLISPSKITKSFYRELIRIFELKKVSFFQLRLKKEKQKNIIGIAKKIQKICKKYKVKFIINDDPILAKRIKSDGCHLGQKDMDINLARRFVGKKIIGITCHNSIRLAKESIKNNANYIAFGAFYSTKTKKTKYKAKITLIKKIKKITSIPIVVIGGINHSNYKKLLLNKADFLAISSYIWKNKNLKPFEAIKKLI